jgi:hypothetical protein
LDRHLDRDNIVTLAAALKQRAAHADEKTETLTMRGYRTARTSSRHRGVSLAEALIAILILWVAVLGIGYTVTAGHQHMQRTEVGMRSMQLAEDMVQEITAKAYAEPGVSVLGTDMGEVARSQYDDIDDYHGYSEAAGALLDCHGDSYGEMDSGLSRQVNVVAASHTLPQLGTVPGKRITVSVYDATNTVWQVVRFVAEPAP